VALPIRVSEDLGFEDMFCLWVFDPRDSVPLMPADAICRWFHESLCDEDSARFYDVRVALAFKFLKTCQIAERDFCHPPRRAAR
jgi:hypothetical protein